jgi:hypothetical protein
MAMAGSHIIVGKWISPELIYILDGPVVIFM